MQCATAFVLLACVVPEAPRPDHDLLSQPTSPDGVPPCVPPSLPCQLMIDSFLRVLLFTEKVDAPHRVPQGTIGGCLAACGSSSASVQANARLRKAWAHYDTAIIIMRSSVSNDDEVIPAHRYNFRCVISQTVLGASDLPAGPGRLILAAAPAGSGRRAALCRPMRSAAAPPPLIFSCLSLGQPQAPLSSCAIKHGLQAYTRCAERWSELDWSRTATYLVGRRVPSSDKTKLEQDEARDGANVLGERVVAGKGLAGIRQGRPNLSQAQNKSKLAAALATCSSSTPFVSASCPSPAALSLLFLRLSPFGRVHT